MLTPHAALVHIMVVVAAADGDMPDSELQRMGHICSTWRAFNSFYTEELPDIARECAVMLQVKDGLEKTLARVRQAVPPRLRETAYLLACEIAPPPRATPAPSNPPQGRATKKPPGVAPRGFVVPPRRTARA